MSVSPPAANTWDLEAVVDAARSRVRANPGDEDEARLQRCAAAAIDDVDQVLDRVPPDETADPPEDAFDAGAVSALFEAAVDRTVERFQARDDDTVVDDDPYTRLRKRVMPYKARWGIG